MHSAGPRAGVNRRLAHCGVFFGEWPASVGFFAILAPADIRQMPRDAPAKLQQALETQVFPDAVQAWPVFGQAFFRGSAAPKELAPLHFNGDDGDVTDLTHRVLAGYFLAGSFVDVIAEIRRLRPFVASIGFTETSAEIGVRFNEGRGHGGFIDGVSNLQELTPQQFAACVFVGAEDPRFTGGCYAVIRKYEENLELWTDLPDTVQEQILGRRKSDGQLLGGGRLWRRDGSEQVLGTAHAASVRPDRCRDRFSWRDRIYRRSVNYTETLSAGAISQGLLFLALNRSPREQIQRIHNAYMLPPDRNADLLMSAGYLRPRRTVVVFVPARATFLTNPVVQPWR
jgi:Dyp-type peroxidase family